MQNLALAVDKLPTSARVAITSGGATGIAVAAAIAAKHSHVTVRLQADTPPEAIPSRLTINGNPQPNFSPKQITCTRFSEEDLSRSDLLILSGKSETYEQEINQIAAALRPGHTVLVLDAPMFTAFQISHKLYQMRKRMAVTIIEAGSLYNNATVTKEGITIEGLHDKVAISGRTVNETRQGLSLARQYFEGLVPASNVLERMLCDCGAMLRTALKLFVVMGSTTGGAEKEKVSFTQAELAVLAAMESELQALGKLFNVSVNTAGPMYDEVSDSLAHEENELARAVITNLVMLSDLARLAYNPVPTIDSVIELASVTLKRDLRKEGRKLADTGLVGMDSREIIELINS